jgi:hypothetical protein
MAGWLAYNLSRARLAYYGRIVHLFSGETTSTV